MNSAVRTKIGLILEKKLVISKSKPFSRKNWAKSFKEMHENGDDKLLIADIFEDEKKLRINF